MNATNEKDKVTLLRNALTPERVCFLDARNKTEALGALIEVLLTSPGITERDELAEAFFKREELMSTGIGLGLAVPHVRLPSVREMTMAVGISDKGIDDYNALDDKPVRLIFMIAAPAGQHTEYLRLLSAISSRAKILNGQLLNCPDADTFYRILTDASSEEAGNPVAGA